MSDDDSEDNVSLVSRTPSPRPQTAHDVSNGYYDDNGEVDHEVVTLETQIKSTNIGYAMLAKFGWKQGQGLGANGSGKSSVASILGAFNSWGIRIGRPDPIPFALKQDSLGLGKAAQIDRVLDATVGQSRLLDSIRLAQETEEERQTREVRHLASCSIFKRSDWFAEQACTEGGDSV